MDSKDNVWTGRIDSESKSLRFHQVMEEKSPFDLEKYKGLAFGLVGFACDEGVKRNHGRAGAAFAPNEVRKMLANLPYTLQRADIIDTGNIVCENEDLEKAQEKLGDAVGELLAKTYTPIIIGGGHETFYGHYLGARKFIGKEAQLGIINIDAHFDLREEERPSSGTMFRQILEADQQAGYLCLGIQPHGNTKSLFAAAKQLNCSYVLEEDILKEQTFQLIDSFCRRHDYVVVTLCTDAIEAAAAPGVSAPSPFGLSTKVVRKLIRHVFANKNVLSFDLSEVNPLVDEGNKTVRLAAYLLAEAMESFHQTM